jgi:hypothetical protein
MVDMADMAEKIISLPFHISIDRHSCFSFSSFFLQFSAPHLFPILVAKQNKKPSSTLSRSVCLTQGRERRET